jgi:hypothetical protein
MLYVKTRDEGREKESCVLYDSRGALYAQTIQ